MSEPTALKTRLARLDLAACWAYIADRNPDAAHRFRLAAEATFLALARTPKIGAPARSRTPACKGFAVPESGDSTTFSSSTGRLTPESM